MPINEHGEFIRPTEVPQATNNEERQKTFEEQRALAERQDSEPEDPIKITAEKKAAIRKRLLGE